MKFEDHHYFIGKTLSIFYIFLLTIQFYSLIPSGAFSEDGKKHVTSMQVRLRKLHGIEQIKHQGK